MLAIPSICAGWLIGWVVFGDYFGDSLVRLMDADWHGLWAYTLHGMTAAPFWLALAGMATAWFLYGRTSDLPKRIAMAFGPLYALVERKYGFDELYSWLFARGARFENRLDTDLGFKLKMLGKALYEGKFRASRTS